MIRLSAHDLTAHEAFDPLFRTDDALADSDATDLTSADRFVGVRPADTQGQSGLTNRERQPFWAFGVRTWRSWLALD